MDFTPEQQALVEKLSVSLNIGIDNLYLALSNRITFSDNFSATQKTFQVQMNADGTPLSPISFKLNTNSNIPPRIIGTQTLQAISLTNPNIYPDGSPFLSFIQNGNSVNINHITGLSVGDTWELTVVIYH